MPAAIYALSYQDTGCIVSYCMLEQQKLPTKDAASALLDRLVADNLMLSLSKSGGPRVKIPKAQLAVDEVQMDTQTLAAFAKQPIGYVIDLGDPATKPGDGKAKKLGTPLVPSYALGSGTATNVPQDAFSVTFATALPGGTNLYAVIDGGSVMREPVSQPIAQVKFPFPCTAQSVHAVLFVGQGVKPYFGLIRAE